MRAVRFHEYGSADVLRVEEVPDPEPGPGQVLVRVTASGVNYADVTWRAGRMGWAKGLMAEPVLPVIPGYEVAGTVVALGDGADPGLLGRRVVTMTGAFGGYAELAVADAEAVVPLNQISDRTAVGLFAQGTTALAALDLAAVRPGETVLVEGAAGGIGTLLVQLAKRAGATVVGAARGAGKLALAARLGADRTVDYTEDGWTDRVGGPVDVVFDLAGGVVTELVFRLLRRGGGRMVIYGVSSGEVPAITTVDIFAAGVSVLSAMGRVNSDPAYRRELHDRLFALAADGAVEPVIGQVVPFAEAPRAHAVFDDRTSIGKTILVP